MASQSQPRWTVILIGTLIGSFLCYPLFEQLRKVYRIGVFSRNVDAATSVANDFLMSLEKNDPRLLKYAPLKIEGLIGYNRDEIVLRVLSATDRNKQLSLRLVKQDSLWKVVEFDEKLAAEKADEEAAKADKAAANAAVHAFMRRLAQGDYSRLAYYKKLLDKEGEKARFVWKIVPLQSRPNVRELHVIFSPNVDFMDRGYSFSARILLRLVKQDGVWKIAEYVEEQ